MVIVCALLDYVELPVFPGIISDAGRVVPVAVVTTDVMVEL